MLYTKGTILTEVNTGDKPMTIIQLADGNIVGVESSLLEDISKPLFSPYTPNLRIVGEGISDESAKPSLKADLQEADSISIDGKPCDGWHAFEDAVGQDVFLDTVEIQFSANDIENATKDGYDWTVVHSETQESYRLVCEQVLAM